MDQSDHDVQQDEEANQGERSEERFHRRGHGSPLVVTSSATPHLTVPLSATVRLLAVKADNFRQAGQDKPRPASRSVNSSREALRQHAGLRTDMVDLAYGAHPVGGDPVLCVA